MSKDNSSKDNVENNIDDNIENVDDINYDAFKFIITSLDKENFNIGMKDGSYWAGFFTALFNAGLNSQQALTFIVNKITLQTELDVANVNKEAQIESSKNKLYNDLKDIL